MSCWGGWSPFSSRRVEECDRSKFRVGATNNPKVPLEVVRREGSMGNGWGQGGDPRRRRGWPRDLCDGGAEGVEEWGRRGRGRQRVHDFRKSRGLLRGRPKRLGRIRGQRSGRRRGPGVGGGGANPLLQENREVDRWKGREGLSGSDLVFLLQKSRRGLHEKGG